MLSLFRGLNGRILLIPVVALLALAILGIVSVQTIGMTTMAGQQDHARVAVEAAVKIVEMFEAKAVVAGRAGPGTRRAAGDPLRRRRIYGRP
jgi:hypothetical protein